MSPPAHDPVVVTIDSAVAQLRLNRPQALNALNPELWCELLQALRKLSVDGGVRAVVICGEGRAFCSGSDIEAAVSSTADDRMEMQSGRMETYLAVLRQLRAMPQPVVAAVQGPAVGAGMAIACLCDLRVIQQGASMHPVFTRLGLSAGDLGLSWTLPRLIGHHAAAEILLTGREVGAAEAVERSLALDGGHDALAVAMKLAGHFAELPSFGVRATKQLLASSFAAGGFERHLELEARTQVLCSLSQEHSAVRAARAATRRKEEA